MRRSSTPNSSTSVQEPPQAKIQKQFVPPSFFDNKMSLIYFFFFKNHTCLMVHHSTVRVSTLSIVENGNQGDECTITTKMFLRSALRSGDDDSNRKLGQPTSTNAGNELAEQQKKNRRGGATGLLPLFYGMHFVARYGTPCCEWVSEVAGASGWTRYLPPIFGLHMWCIGEDVWRREPMPRFRFGADI
jgi:hypothetical protein